MPNESPVGWTSHETSLFLKAAFSAAAGLLVTYLPVLVAGHDWGQWSALVTIGTAAVVHSAALYVTDNAPKDK